MLQNIDFKNTSLKYYSKVSVIFFLSECFWIIFQYHVYLGANQKQHNLVICTADCFPLVIALPLWLPSFKNNHMGCQNARLELEVQNQIMSSSLFKKGDYITLVGM